MLEEKDSLEPNHEVSANNYPRAGADNTMEQFVDPFLLVPQETEATWDNRVLSTGCFSNPTPKKVFQKYFSPTALFHLVFDNEVVQYLVDTTNLNALRDKGKHSFNISRSEMRLFIAILCFPDTMYFLVKRCIGKIVTMLKTNLFPMQCYKTDLKRSYHCCTTVTTNSLVRMTKCLR